MIELIDLTKIYRGIRAVDGLNLRVGEGRVFGFLGPNGAGKTTTIRMMAGVLKPTSGRILIAGKDLARDPSAVKRCVGFIPDRPFVYEKLTGLEFLHFVGSLYGLADGSETERRIGRLMETFELTNWGDELVESYSHGMKQRLVMCSALLHEPRVLIVDEPMVGLDPKAARLVKNLFRGQAGKGVTVFMSTHSLEVAEEVCDEIAIIMSGKVIAQGDAASLRAQAGVDGSLERVFFTLTEEGRAAHG